MFTCHHCGQELAHHDIYGRLCAHQDGVKLGDIYKCQNEAADCYGTSYHTRGDADELIEGYPC